MYENCKLYGPYSSGKDGRLRAILVNPDGTKTTISYPKYIIEKYYNKQLTENETVDHIDGNFLNNDISNLRIVDRKLHATLDVKRNANVKVKCIYCGKEFEIDGSKIHNRNRHRTGYFCSKQCSGRYGSDIQKGISGKEKVNKIIPGKFTIKIKSAK